MYGIEKGAVLCSFRFDTIFNITQEPLELQRYNCVWVHCKSYVIKYQLLLSKI